MNNGRKLIRDLIATLQQGAELVSAVADEVYAEGIAELSASSIGAHYRHHLDHVRSVVVGLKSGVVDYDDRVRGTDIEFDRDVALAATGELIGALERICADDLTAQCTVLQRSCAGGTSRPESPATMMRELAFLQSHAIHHYALIGLVARIKGVTVPDGFGLMPSTITYQQELPAASPCAPPTPLRR